MIIAILLLSLPALAADFRMGRAAVKITPGAGVPMAGYYHVRLNEGIHDDLYAKAIVLDQEGAKAALVALDLISTPRRTIEDARKRIAIATGITSVMISATHSHTGPELGFRLRGVDPATEKTARAYIDALPGKIAESVSLAASDLRTVRVRVAEGREPSVSFVRRFYMKDGSVGWNPGKLNPNILRPTTGVDPALPVVVFETPDGKPLAAYLNFACHLDTVGGMQFSADYPYTISRLLSDVKGSDFMTMFTIGTAGNINHVDVSHREPQKGPGEAARIGTLLAANVLRLWSSLQPADTSRLKSSSEIVKLPLAEYASSDVAKAKQILAAYGKPGAHPFLDQVQAFKVAELEARDGRPLEAEVQVITLGDQIAWVALPGEIFVELGRAIKAASPFRHTIIATLANGSVGYVPDRKAYPQGAYEVISARMASGGGEKLVDAATRMLIGAYPRKGN